jgi:hypothetical protein
MTLTWVFSTPKMNMKEVVEAADERHTEVSFLLAICAHTSADDPGFL